MKALVVVLVAVVAGAVAAPQFIYNYAFQIPGVDTTGQADGTFVYNNPVGAPIFHQNPTVFLTPGGAQVVPQTQFVAPVLVKNAQNTAAEEVPGTQPSHNALSPLLRQAATSGNIVFLRESSPGVLQYSVSPDYTQDTQSISSLAAKLNAIPVAAVHDAQAPPRFRGSDSSADPVLTYREQGGATQFRLEIPTQ